MEVGVNVGKRLDDLVDVAARLEAEHHAEIAELKVQVDQRGAAFDVTGQRGGDVDSQQRLADATFTG